MENQIYLKGAFAMNKATIWIKEKAMKAKDVILPAIVCMIPGLLIGGSLTAIVDRHRIDKLEKNQDEIVRVFNENVDKSNNFKGWTYEQINELARQNAVLMEKALQETEGKAG